MVLRVISCAQVLRPSVRELVLAALPGVDELRSTTSRMALLFFQVRLEASCCFVQCHCCCTVLALLQSRDDEALHTA
jgi:hypothetical protein